MVVPFHKIRLILREILNRACVQRLVCYIGGASVVVLAISSLSWRMVHDTPIMMYLSNLMIRGRAIPYRDFVDMNLPGSYWMFGVIIRMLGESDVAVHFANFIIIVVVCTMMCWAMSRANLWVGVVGVVFGALRIVSGVWSFVLQRELFALIPISTLLVLGLRRPIHGMFSGAVVGVLMAWLALIKPQLLLYGIPVILLLMGNCGSLKQRIRLAMAAVCCFMLPFVACGWWLVENGAWAGFLDIVQYWTLYGQMTHEHGFVDANARLVSIMVGASMMVFSPYMFVAIWGLYSGWKSKAISIQELCLWCGVLVVTVIVPSVSGQFWGYHKLPFFFLTLCASGYLLLGCLFARMACILMVVFWVSFSSVRVWRETAESSVVSLKHGVPDELGNYLRHRLRPGDHVQPVDWTGGALHGMFMVDAPLATRFPYTFYFFHHVSHPLIQKFRREFMNDLNEKPPRFILECTRIVLPSGVDTAKRFPEFETWRDSHYRVVQSDEYYRIWELIQDMKFEK